MSNAKRIAVDPKQQQGPAPAGARQALSAQLAQEGVCSAQHLVQTLMAACGDLLNRRISHKEATGLARLGEAIARDSLAAPEINSTLRGEAETAAPLLPSPDPTALQRRKAALEAELAALNGQLE